MNPALFSFNRKKKVYLDRINTLRALYFSTLLLTLWRSRENVHVLIADLPCSAFAEYGNKVKRYALSSHKTEIAKISIDTDETSVMLSLVICVNTPSLRGAGFPYNSAWGVYSVHYVYLVFGDTTFCYEQYMAFLTLFSLYL